MSFVFVCRYCKAELKAENHIAGKKASCPKCCKSIVIPKKGSDPQSEGKVTSKRE